MEKKRSIRRNIGGALTSLVAGAIMATTLSSDSYNYNLNNQKDIKPIMFQESEKPNTNYTSIYDFISDPLAEHISDSTDAPLSMEEILEKNDSIQKAKRKVKPDGPEFKRYYENKSRDFYEALTDSIIQTIHPDMFTDVVTRYVLKGTAKQESDYDPNAKSPTGPRGTNQLTRRVYETFGEGSYEKNVYNPAKNIPAGLGYLLYIENYLAHKDPLWEKRSTKTKQQLVLMSYYDGHVGIFKDLKAAHWNVNKLPEYASPESVKHANAVFARIDYIKKEESEERTAYLLVNDKNNSLNAADSTNTTPVTVKNIKD
jgi:hypothetical protein